MNSYLEFVKSNLYLKKRELEESGKEFSALEFKNFYLRIDRESKTLLEIFKDHNEK